MMLRSILTFVLVLATAAAAGEVELPTPLQQVAPGLHTSGTATLHWFGLHVYDITLYVVGAPYTTNGTAALSIRYRMSFKRKRLLETTLKELRRLDEGDETQRGMWAKELALLWPDIKHDDRLTAYRQLNGPTQFYFNDTLLGGIADPAFGPSFFAIWLDADCRYPAVRDRLLELKDTNTKGR